MEENVMAEDVEDDYEPGVDPYTKPTEKELGFKPLSNAEFDLVKARAGETVEERWGGIYGLGLGKTEEEFDTQLSREKSWLKQFENAEEDRQASIHLEDRDPAIMFHVRYTFERVANFFNRLFGRTNNK